MGVRDRPKSTRQSNLQKKGQSVDSDRDRKQRALDRAGRRSTKRKSGGINKTN